jgi:hypothetical protein
MSSAPVWSSRIAPPVLNRHSPSRPSQRNAAHDASACTLDPLGTSIRTSTEGPALKKLYRRQLFGALIISRPATYSTVVCAAALTSDLFDALRGRTSTTVSARSVAVIHASPTGRSTWTEIGSGVSKTGMVVSRNVVDGRCCW